MDCQRSLFDIPDNIHYLNCAYNGPLLHSAYRSGLHTLEQRRHPWEYQVRDFFEPMEKAKRLFARIIGVHNPQRIAIIPSASYGLASVAKNLPVGRGDNIVVAEGQFPSNIYTWMRLCKESGASLKIVQKPADQSGKTWNMHLLNAIDPQTRAVAIGQVHWADGTLFDLEEIRKRTSDVKAMLVVDGTQSIGAFPFDQNKINADAIICAGYKWLFGPYSLGFGYFGPTFDDGVPIEENWITRLNSDHFKGLVSYESRYRPGAYRYSVGECSNFLLLPILISALKQVLEWGTDQIQTYCDQLASTSLERIRAMGYTIRPRDERGAHLFGIQIHEGADPQVLSKALEKHHVFVSLRGNAIRVSPHVYNTRNDMEALISALEDCKKD